MAKDCSHEFESLEFKVLFLKSKHARETSLATRSHVYKQTKFNIAILVEGH